MSNRQAAMASNNAQNIQVAVRCRPLNERENKMNSYSIIECNEKTKEITAFDKSGTMQLDKKFTFDKVFGVSSKQSEVYNQIVKPVVLEVIEGYNCTIFAYGQTGTGKTHTMEGSWSTVDDLSQSWDSDQMVGIIPRSVAHLFTCLNSISSCEYSVKISFIELYNEELSDLLTENNDTDKLRIFDDPERKGSVKIPGLEEIVVRNKAEVYKILQRGSQRRQQASTLMNAKSSRSHSIFTLTVFIKEKSIEGEETIKVGKLNLVDLAGSENIERSGATGKRAAEAGRINKSLTTLGRVITALVEHRDHIPYRESNLTRLLQDSLGGRTKTTLIATISPAMCNLEETLSTLDYAHKAKSIRNKPEVNQKLVKKALIKEYTEEIEKLKRELYSTREKNGIYIPQDMYEEMENEIRNKREEIRENLNKISSLTEDKEKLEEVLDDTKLNLAERTQQLKKTTETLHHTECHLEKVKTECDETKYLLDEQISTEKRLYADAVFLKSLTIDQNYDLEKLHDKVGRLMSTINNNKDLTEQFSQHMCGKIKELQRNDLSKSLEHTNSLCSVCDALVEVTDRLEEMKTENVCQLNIFEQKQQNWLEVRQLFIDKEIKVSLDKFLASLNTEATNTCQLTEKNSVAQLKICSEHSLMFVHTCEELAAHIHTTVAHNTQFKKSFENGAQVLMAKQEADAKSDTETIVREIKSLAKSVDATLNDLADLNNMKSMFQETLEESLKSFQNMIGQFTKQISENFEKIDSKIARISENNDQNLCELNKLKKMARDQVEIRLSAGKRDFNELVVVPVAELLEANNQNLTEINGLSRQLADKYQESMSYFQTSIEDVKQVQANSAIRLNKICSEQADKLQKDTQSLRCDFENFGKDSERFFANFTASSIENELVEVLETVYEATNEIKITNHSIGVRSEDMQKYCGQSMHSIGIFANEEFEEVVESGQTPRPKEFEKPGELPQTRDHQELIESYRKKLKELDSMSPPEQPKNTDGLQKASSESNVLNCVQNENKIETSQPLKRVATDKENLSEKVNKQSKLAVAKPKASKRPAFGLSN